MQFNADSRTLRWAEFFARELDLRGSFRFHEEFVTTGKPMQSGLVDVKPVVTHAIPLEDTEPAFRIADDRGRSMRTRSAFD